MNHEQTTIINNFISSLEEFDAVMANAPTDALDWAEMEGEWTVRHVIHHMAEDCNVYAFIIERAIALPGSKVIFGEYPGNQDWADRLAFGKRPTEPAIELMHAHRKFLAELVGFFPDRWDNKVNFLNEEGKELATSSVKDIMVMLTDHMREHTEMVEKIINSKEPKQT